MAIFYPDGDGGRTTIAGGSDYSLPTASTSVKGGIIVGTGLAMEGDRMHVTVQGGGGTGESFTGATQWTAGKGGEVPAPMAGEQDKVLCGNGTWMAMSTTVTIGTTPSTVDGAVWFSI